MGVDGKEMSLTMAEKERVFIDAIQSYYFDGRQVLTDAEFDQLKEDLAWEGSEYAVLSRDETRFLGAMGAYARGETEIMSPRRRGRPGRGSSARAEAASSERRGENDGRSLGGLLAREAPQRAPGGLAFASSRRARALPRRPSR